MLDGIHTAWLAMSGWEVAAVLLSLLYLVLAIRQNALCWYAAFASTAIFTVLFWDVSLLMESALNAYYLVMAVYGWLLWRRGSSDQPQRPIVRWQWRQHLIALVLIGTLSLISGGLLSEHTQAAMPYLDSITTWGAVVTTWMVARKVLENWLYWLVIDALSVYLFLERGLMLTAVLFMIYEVMVLFGLWRWWRDYQAQNAEPHALDVDALPSGAKG